MSCSTHSLYAEPIAASSTSINTTAITNWHYVQCSTLARQRYPAKRNCGSNSFQEQCSTLARQVYPAKKLQVKLFPCSMLNTGSATVSSKEKLLVKIFPCSMLDTGAATVSSQYKMRVKLFPFSMLNNLIRFSMLNIVSANGSSEEIACQTRSFVNAKHWLGNGIQHK